MAVYYVGMAGDVITRVVETTRVEYSQLQAGGPIAQYDLVYLDGDYVRVAQANAVGTMPVQGMAFAASGASGARMSILIRGVVSNGNWNFTSNAILYMSALSGGLMTNTAPPSSGNIVQRLGKSRLPTSIDFNPEDNYVTVAA